MKRYIFILFFLTGCAADSFGDYRTDWEVANNIELTEEQRSYRIKQKKIERNLERRERMKNCDFTFQPVCW